MYARTSRLLLVFAAVLSALGAAVHAAAFTKARAAMTASNTPHFYVASSEALWLSDSATLLVTAAMLGFMAAKPRQGAATTVMLVALIPAATSLLLYIFLGSFFAAHLLLFIAVLSFLAGLALPREDRASSARLGSS